MAPVERQIESLRAQGTEVEVLEVEGIPKLKYVQTLPRLYAQARCVDLIHAHYGFCGWLARSQFRKPVVVSFMGDDLLGTPNANGQVELLSKFTVQADRWFARTVSAVIVKSAEMAEVLKPVPAHVVPNGVDMDLFQPMDAQNARAKLGWSENVSYILFPGNPSNPRKGFPLAESVVTRAKAQTNDSTTGRLLKLVTLWNVPYAQVPLYMNACDAMLMTSFIEGSPNVVKEAMACNLPIISVPVGDVVDLLDGVPGYYVCPRDTQLMADALVATLGGSTVVDGRTALKQKKLDLESVARQLLHIYEEVLR